MRKSERPGDRVRRFRLAMKQTQDVFASMLDFSTSQVSLIEANQRKISTVFLERFAAKFSASPEWVMAGEGSPVPSGWERGDPKEFVRRLEDIRRAEQARDLVKETSPVYQRGYSIPVVSHAAANPKKRIELEDVENEWAEFPAGIVAIRITDESMSPVAWPGQLVLCDPDASVNNGDLVVAKIKYRGLLFKRVYFEKERGLVMLHSVNQARSEPPLIVERDDVEYRFKVIGVKFE